MDIQAIHAILLERFGAAAVGDKPHSAIDPWIQVAPSSIAEVGKYVRDEPRLDFKHLNDLCGADYLETDPKKVAFTSPVRIRATREGLQLVDRKYGDDGHATWKIREIALKK